MFKSLQCGISRCLNANNVHITSQLLSETKVAVGGSANYAVNVHARSKSHFRDIPDLKPINKVKDVQFPERRRLYMYEKVPNPEPTWIARTVKHSKKLIEMRGPEEIHNTLVHKQFGIRALAGGYMRWGHYELLRLGISRKINQKNMFAEWRIGQPWKPVTKKGQGHRMGKGKGPVNEFVHPVKPGRIIAEVGGECGYEDVFPFLDDFAKKMPFKAEAVSYEIMEQEKQKALEDEKANKNPFTMEYCIKNNMLGCRSWLSPYDYKWHGKDRVKISYGKQLRVKIR